MKVETWLFAMLIPFFVGVGIWYAWWTDFEEPVGIFGILLTGGLCAFIAGYLWLTGRKIDARPEDNPLAEQWEAEGEYGFYSPHSWWPLWLGASLALLVFGAAVGWWLAAVSIPFVAIASIGWTFEYFKGEHSL